jgi:hypothetical protein
MQGRTMVGNGRAWDRLDAAEYKMEEKRTNSGPFGESPDKHSTIRFRDAGAKCYMSAWAHLTRELIHTQPGHEFLCPDRLVDPEDIRFAFCNHTRVC